MIMLVAYAFSMLKAAKAHRVVRLIGAPLYAHQELWMRATICDNKIIVIVIRVMIK